MGLGSETEGLVEAMQRLQFTATEARLYTALLQEHPATGYDLAARSGVPRSAIYSNLKKMEARGIIRPVSQNPARYAPLPPDTLCDQLERHYTEHIEGLRTAIERVPVARKASELWQVFGYDDVLDEARARIDGAKHSVFASTWRREATALVPSFDAAVDRGVAVTLFAFTDLPPTRARTFAAGIPEPDLEAYWPHRLVMVLDKTLLVLGEMSTGQAYAVVSEEPALVSMGANNLILDLTLHGQRFGVDVSAVVAGLQDKLAPIDELLSARGQR